MHDLPAQTHFGFNGPDINERVRMRFDQSMPCSLAESSLLSVVAIVPHDVPAAERERLPNIGSTSTVGGSVRRLAKFSATSRELAAWSRFVKLASPNVSSIVLKMDV